MYISIITLFLQTLIKKTTDKSAYPFVDLHNAYNLQGENMKDGQVHHCVLSDTCLWNKKGKRVTFCYPFCILHISS